MKSEQKTQKKQKPKKPDRLQQIKYVAYCRSQTPPGERTSLEDLVNFAKFFLCKHSKRLWKDEIWEQYTDEEILVEYYSLLFAQDVVSRRQFEVEIDAGSEVYGEDVFNWLDRKVKENQAEMKKQIEELEDNVSFKPDTMGDA